ncbi:MAG: hydrolase [Acidimicrobiia bacterium]|nr:hydrolase [Acidimicrobiia bacterium]
MVSPGSELVEIVDGSDRVLTVVTRAEMRAQRLRHRAVAVVVRSSAAEVLVHQRSPDKDLWPSRWDLCVGGVVAAGESYEDAASRELAEEVGVTAAVPALLGSVAYEDDDVMWVGRVYTVTSDGPFTFSDGEVVQARFVALSALAALITAEQFVPDSVAVVLPLLL